MQNCASSEDGATSSASAYSKKDTTSIVSNQSIETLALKSQLKTAKLEITSLQRRNTDLEVLLQEKECLLTDVVAKFKKERAALKARIIKLETRLNKSTYDESLDLKPAKIAKSAMLEADFLKPQVAKSVHKESSTHLAKKKEPSFDDSKSEGNNQPKSNNSKHSNSNQIVESKQLNKQKTQMALNNKLET